MPAPNLQDDRRKQDSSNTTRDYFEQKLIDSLGQDDITKGIIPLFFINPQELLQYS